MSTDRPSWRTPAPSRPLGAADPLDVPDPTSVDHDSHQAPAPVLAAPTEDPRDMARRLAAEAKARVAAQGHPPAPAAQPAAPAGKFGGAPPPRAAQAAPPPRAAAAPQAPARPAYEDSDLDYDGPTPFRTSAEDFGTLDDGEPSNVAPMKGLAGRNLPPVAPKATGKLSAADALRAAMDAESRPTPQTPPAPRPPAQAPRQAAAPAAAPAARTHDASTVVIAAFAGLPDAPQVTSTVAVTKPDIFRALWRAHRARALHEGDLPLAATGSVVLDALDRLPSGGLVAARVRIGGTEWAAWVDTTRGVLLGVARPAEIYLAGL